MKVGPKCGITSNSQCDLSHPAHSCANHSSQESTRNKNPHPSPLSVGWDGVVVQCCAVSMKNGRPKNRPPVKYISKQMDAPFLLSGTQLPQLAYCDACGCGGAFEEGVCKFAL